MRKMQLIILSIIGMILIVNTVSVKAGLWEDILGIFGLGAEDTSPSPSPQKQSNEINYPVYESYTYSTYEECSRGICTKKLYPNTRFGKEHGEWKPIEELSSLKGTPIKCTIESDGIHKVECLDYNMTSILMNFSFYENVTEKEIEIEENKIKLKIKQIDEFNNEKELEIEIEDFVNISEASYLYEFVNESVLGKEIHFGESSSIVTLTDTSNNLQNAYVKRDSPEDNFGNDEDMRIGHWDVSQVYTTYIKILSDIENVVELENYTLVFHLHGEDINANKNATVYKLLDNVAWDEDTINYADSPQNTSGINHTILGYINVLNGDSAGTEYQIELTDYINDIQNMSFFLNISDTGMYEYFAFRGRSYLDGWYAVVEYKTQTIIGNDNFCNFYGCNNIEYNSNDKTVDLITTDLINNNLTPVIGYVTADGDSGTERAIFKALLTNNSLRNFSFISIDEDWINLSQHDSLVDVYFFGDFSGCDQLDLQNATKPLFFGRDEWAIYYHVCNSSTDGADSQEYIVNNTHPIFNETSVGENTFHSGVKDYNGCNLFNINNDTVYSREDIDSYTKRSGAIIENNTDLLGETTDSRWFLSMFEDDTTFTSLGENMTIKAFNWLIELHDTRNYYGNTTNAFVFYENESYSHWNCSFIVDDTDEESTFCFLAVNIDQTPIYCSNQTGLEYSGDEFFVYPIWNTTNANKPTKFESMTCVGYNGTVEDTTPPTVNLTSPDNGYSTTSFYPEFCYNVSEISNCTLYINNTYYGANYSVTADTEYCITPLGVLYIKNSTATKYSGSCTNPDNFFDSNYATAGYATNAGDSCIWEINYTREDYYDYVEWEKKGGANYLNEPLNFSVNDTCQDEDGVYMFRAISMRDASSPSNRLYWECYNGSSWINITYTEDDVVAHRYAYDESINIYHGLDYGDYEWHINCTDSSGNEGSSETRNISITVPVTTCNWTSGRINCSNYCNITSNTLVSTDLYLLDTGTVTISADLNVTGFINKTTNCIINKTSSGRIIT